MHWFYKSKEWSDLLQVLKMERAADDGILYCEHCGLPITKKYDCIGHHITELNETNIHDADTALNPDNIMLVHHRCHNKIHERFGYYKPKVYIVYGSPCSGKSTWVKDTAYDDDLIIDIDRLWESVCLCDKHHKPNRLKANVFALRDMLLDQVKTRTGKWRNAYVIGGYPLASDRERLSKRLGAELVFIEEDKEICLSRCLNEDWKEYVEEWFEVYTPAPDKNF